MDMRSFYLLSDAAELGEADERSWISIWQLQRLVPLREEWPDEPTALTNFVVFADQGIRAWDYAISVGTSPNVVVVPNATANPPVVARSFTEFLELLLTEPEALYPPAA